MRGDKNEFESLFESLSEPLHSRFIRRLKRYLHSLQLPNWRLVHGHVMPDWLQIILSLTLWKLIVACALVSILPISVLYGLLRLPWFLRPVFTIGILIGWGIASGYKDWYLVHRREEEH